MYEIEMYQTQNGRAPIKEYMQKLAKESKEKELAQIILYKNRLAEYGMAVNNVYPETIRKIRDGIYELRPGQTACSFSITLAASMCSCMLTENRVEKLQHLKLKKQ